MKNIFTKSIFGLLCFSFLFNYCQKPEETVVHIDKDEFSLYDQRKIGENLSNIITENQPVIKTEENPEFHEYIDRLFNAIVNNSLVSNRNTFDWEIILLKNDKLYSSFALPGGKICVYTGLLKMLKGENELFSILAHEMYYSEKEAVIDAMIKRYGTFIIGDLMLGTQSQGALDIARSIQNLDYPIEVVLQADKFMSETICPLPYDASGLNDFIERASLMTSEIKWLGTHPVTLERLNMLESSTQDCGTGKSSFADRYEYYKSLLP